MTTTTKENVSMGSVRELLIEQMRSLTEKGSLTADEGRHFDAMEKAVRVIGQVDTATLAGVDRNHVGSVLENGLWSSGEPAAATVRGGRKMSEMFGPAPQSKTFKSVEDQARAMVLGDSQRLMLAGAEIGTPSDGGFLVPLQQAFAMLDKSLEGEVVRPRARPEPMTSNTKMISTFDDSTHASGELFGGLNGSWTAEGEELTYEIVKVRRMQLTAHKLTYLTAASNELLTDVAGYEGGLSSRLTAALGWNLDRTFLATGTGAGQPRAILRDPALIVVAKENGQAADTLCYENFVQLFGRAHPACLSRMIWIVNQTAIPQLLKLTITLAGGTQFVPVMTGSNGNYEILGRPVVFTEKLNLLGDEGDILFVDLSQYAVGIVRDGMRLDRSAHVRYVTDETAYRLIMRADGQGVWQSAFQPVNSAPTLSWCVTLQAR